MNIDFSQDATFSTYVCLLLFSGLAMLIASAAAKNRTRVLDLLFGAGFLGYGFYLAFLFDGGSYMMFFYAFIVPVMMIYRTFMEWLEKPKAGAVPAAAEPVPTQAP